MSLKVYIWHMRWKLLFCLGVSAFTRVSAQDAADSVMLSRIFREGLRNGKAYENLRVLCKEIGPRLSGSPQADKAVEWGLNTFSALRPDSVFLQPIAVPQWVRGSAEEAAIITQMGIKRSNKSRPFAVETAPLRMPVRICALGGSIATSPEGLEAQVVEITRPTQLDSLGRKGVEGKIVFFNIPMDPTRINTFDAYGPAVRYRGAGARMAARYGALGAMIRSVTLATDTNPHTGAMGYVDSIPKIPACAISTVHANLLHDLLGKDPSLSFWFKQQCAYKGEVPSNNVIAELRGSEKPEEVITLGGHLDSWDLAEGAHDDGAGIVQTIECLRLLKQLGYKPKRTIRFVLFMNEENGLRGGKEYGAWAARRKNERYIAAMESDAGGFAPDGFCSEGTPAQRKRMQSWEPLFRPYGLHSFDREGGGADISPLEPLGTMMVELMPESQRYFDVHHSALDVLESVNPRELHLGAAAMAGMLYLLDRYGVSVADGK